MTNSEQPFNNDRCNARKPSELEAADLWATAENGELQAANLPEDETARNDAADLRFLHVLLQRIAHPDDAGRERRVERVLAAIDDEPVDSTARHIVTPLPTEVPTTPSARWFPLGRRWVMSALSVAAGLMVLAVIWAGSNGTEVSAYAAVEQVYSAATSMQDREYSVLSELNKSNQVVEVESTLYVRGGEKYSIRHPSMLGEIWIGNNGDHSWLVPPSGIVMTREESRDNPHYIRRWTNDTGFVIPELQLTALIAHLRDQYELELLPSEPLSTTPPALDAAAAETLDAEQLARTEVMWRRIRGTLNVEQPGRPEVVDVWCHPETGVARRIELVWRRDPGADSSDGLRRMTVNLVRDHVFDDSWYEAESHPPTAAATSGAKQD